MEDFFSTSLTTSLSGINSSKSEIEADLHDFKINLSRNLNSNQLLKFNDDSISIKKSIIKKVQDKCLRATKFNSSTPCMPVKCTTNANYTQSFGKSIKKPRKKFKSEKTKEINASESDNDLEKSIYSDLFYNFNSNDFIQSRYGSPFLLRRPSKTDSENTVEEILSNSEHAFKKTNSFVNLTTQSCQNLCQDDKISRISSSVSHSTLMTNSDSGLSSINSTQLFLADLRECLKQSSNSNLSCPNDKEKCRRSEYIKLINITGYKNKIKSLIKKYPDKCCTGSNRRKMQTPFDNANLETLEFLLQLKKEENIPINQIADQDGNSLMHKAIIYNQFEVVRYLLANYPSLVSLKNCYGIYPIHLCVLRGNMEILRLICRESKKFINKRDLNGFTPAMHAAIEGKYESLKYILDNGNAKFNKVTKNTRLNKYTLLHLGVVSGSLDVVQYLLMKMGISYMKSRTKDNATVFHLAAARGHDQILEYLLAIKYSKIIRHAKDITGSTPAHDAAENGHCKCLKILNDAGLDMYAEDIEHITPLDLAMASKNAECRAFANSLKPMMSLDDGPILINNSSLLTIDLNNTSIIIPQNGGSKKTPNTNLIVKTTFAARQHQNSMLPVNLRRISSMLRLRRAKDLNHEPAYLYTQRFRPAPVSLPQSSQITGFQNSSPSNHENEDDLNDSAIDELINHVHNNNSKKSQKQKQKSSASPCSANQSSSRSSVIDKTTSKSIKNEKVITDEIINRVSRYQQHCQQLENSDYSEPKKQSESLKSDKNSEAAHLGVILKNSLSSSRDSTPTVIKIPRAATPTPLLQSVIHKSVTTDETKSSSENNNEAIATESIEIKSAMEIFKEKEKPTNKATIIDSENNKPSLVIPPPPPMPPPLQQQVSAPRISPSLSTRLPTHKNLDSSDYCTIREAKQAIETPQLNNWPKMSPNSLKIFQRKSVAFQDGPPKEIETNIRQEGETVLRKHSLGRYNSRSEFNIEMKARRKSLTNYISDKAALVTNVHTRLFNSKSTNHLVKSDVEIKKVTSEYRGEKNISESDYSRLNRKSKQFFEPEPDYWDTPKDNYNTEKEIPLKIIHQGKITSPDISPLESPNLDINKKSTKKAVSLAQIIVQSISSSNSNKSSLSSYSSKVTKPNKSESFIDKLVLPVTETRAKSPSNNSKIALFYNSQQTSPIIPHADYDQNQTTAKHDISHHSDNNFSSNVYNSLDDEKHSLIGDDKMILKKNEFIQSFQTAGSSSAVYSEEFEINYSQTAATKNTSIPPAPPMPPPPPPMPALGFIRSSSNKNSDNSLTSSPLLTASSTSTPIHKPSLLQAISLDSETLVTARQKLKIQTSNASSSSESNSSSDKENDKTNADEKKKQNEFLLKEIQNHRLYNTKKDYVLDFLDRGHDKKSNKARENSTKQIVTTSQNYQSCIIVVNNKTNITSNHPYTSKNNHISEDSNVFNRSLSSLNFNKHLESGNDDSFSKETNDVTNLHHTTISPSSSSSSSEIKHSSNVNFERFPYTRNPKQHYHQNNKYSSNYQVVKSSNETSQRATSLTSTGSNRNILPNYWKKQQRDTSSEQSSFKKNSISSKSVSVHNLNQPIEAHESTSKKVLKISISNSQTESPGSVSQNKTIMANKKMSSSISDLLSNYEQQINNNQANKSNCYLNTAKNNQTPVKNFSTIGAPMLETNHLNQNRNNQIKFNRSKPFQMQFEESFFKKQNSLVAATNSSQSNNAYHESRSNKIVNRISNEDESNSTIEANSRNILKKQKLLVHEPTEKYESELERVFKKRALQKMS